MLILCSASFLFFVIETLNNLLILLQYSSSLSSICLLSFVFSPFSQLGGGYFPNLEFSMWCLFPSRERSNGVNVNYANCHTMVLVAPSVGKCRCTTTDGTKKCSYSSSHRLLSPIALTYNIKAFAYHILLTCIEIAT